jgi:hypothetical protein
VISQLARAGEEAAHLAGATGRRPASGCCRCSCRSPLFMAEPDMSVWIHSTPRSSKAQAVGAAEDVALDVALGLGRGLRRVAGQHEVVPAQGGAVEVAVVLPADDVAHACCWRAGWPRPRPAGRAAPRLLLLVSVQYTQPLAGSMASHSGRSILVAPSRSLAWRALISTSPWSAKPLAAVSGPWPCTSGSQRPRRRRRNAPRTACRGPAARGWPGRRRRRGRWVAADELVDVLEARVFARRPPPGRHG